MCYAADSKGLQMECTGPPLEGHELHVTWSLAVNNEVQDHLNGVITRLPPEHMTSIPQ